MPRITGGNFLLGSKSTLPSFPWKGLVTAKTTNFHAETLQDDWGRIRDATKVGSAMLARVSIFTPQGENRRRMGWQRSLIVGTLNVHGCNMDEKKCMIVDMFRERKMDVLVLSETKVKSIGECEWEGERVIVSGLSERMRACEGVAVLIKGRLWGKYN